MNNPRGRGDILEEQERKHFPHPNNSAAVWSHSAKTDGDPTTHRSNYGSDGSDEVDVFRLAKVCVAADVFRLAKAQRRQLLVLKKSTPAPASLESFSFSLFSSFSTGPDAREFLPHKPGVEFDGDVHLVPSWFPAASNNYRRQLAADLVAAGAGHNRRYRQGR